MRVERHVLVMPNSFASVYHLLRRVADAEARQLDCWRVTISAGAHADALLLLLLLCMLGMIFRTYGSTYWMVHLGTMHTHDTPPTLLAADRKDYFQHLPYSLQPAAQQPADGYKVPAQVLGWLRHPQDNDNTCCVTMMVAQREQFTMVPRLSTAAQVAGMFWNYMSIGADAAAAHGFHQLRETKPWAARGRYTNQSWCARIVMARGSHGRRPACATAAGSPQ
jgi:hypothetical protein